MREEEPRKRVSQHGTVGLRVGWVFIGDSNGVRTSNVITGWKWARTSFRSVPRSTLADHLSLAENEGLEGFYGPFKLCYTYVRPSPPSPRSTDPDTQLNHLGDTLHLNGDPPAEAVAALPHVQEEDFVALFGDGETGKFFERRDEVDRGRLVLGARLARMFPEDA